MQLGEERLLMVVSFQKSSCLIADGGVGGAKKVVGGVKSDLDLVPHSSKRGKREKG